MHWLVGGRHRLVGVRPPPARRLTVMLPHLRPWWLAAAQRGAASPRTERGVWHSRGVTGVFTTAATATVMFLMRDEADRPAASNGEQARFVRVLVALVAGATAGAALVLHARAWAPLLPLAATAGVLAAATSAWPP